MIHFLFGAVQEVAHLSTFVEWWIVDIFVGFLAILRRNFVVS